MKNLKWNKLFFLSVTTLLVLTGCNNTYKQEESQSEKIENSNEQIENGETFDNFETEKKEIKDAINEEDFEKAIKKGKDLFITGVDFLIYDKEINGITFDDLTEESKDITLQNLNTIDGWIMQLDPDYKENLSEKYQQIKDFSNETIEKIKEKVKTNLGEEKYNQIKDTKDEIKETIKEKTSETSEKVKQKADEWYQNFKTK